MRLLSRSIAIVAVTTASACGGDLGTSPASTVELLSVSPAAASVGVSVSSSVILTFSSPMMAGMEARVMLHEGSVTGPEVAGFASWTSGRTVLTFTPSAPLKSHANYVIHLAGDMRGASGSSLNHEACAARGGSVVTGGMMSGGYSGGMMGPGWRSASGSYGMIFAFTTG
jgi:hypothetical protein